MTSSSPPPSIRRVQSRAGVEMPALGQGTWMMGERSGQRKREVEALQLGLDLGMTLIDTAEMYASGGSERVVAEAIRGRRDEVFLVTKVLPQNASREGTVRAAERSLKRLGVEAVDLYLLHWPGPHPLQETVEAFQLLVEQGKIRSWGVSNFDVGEMDQLLALPGGTEVVTNQVLYNLGRRGLERNLLPKCEEAGVILMAYSPLEQGNLPGKSALAQVARRHEATVAQVMIAWTLRLPIVVSIPKASSLDHVRQNAAALDLELTPQDLVDLDRAFPSPDRDVPLETL